jgi:uncharacterized protein YggU (UPF0235/DUF167 family)
LKKYKFVIKMKFIKIKASSNSKKNKITEIAKDVFEICVKAKAENNLANQMILEILAEYFQKDIKKIIIIRGKKSKNKWVQIYD